MSGLGEGEPPLGEGDLALVARLRIELGEARTLEYAPDLRPAAARRARHVHRAWLRASAPILALHDQTLLRSGEEGFVVTAEHLGFRGFLEEPWAVRWAEVDLGSVRVEAHRFVVGAVGGHLEDRLLLGRLLRLVRVFGALPRGPYR